MDLVFDFAAEGDLDAIYSMYRDAARVGRERGNSEWDEFYPNRELMMQDFAMRGLFVLRAEGRIVAAVTLRKEEEDLCALDMPWTMPRPCFPMRLCVAPAMQNRGIAARMIAKLAAYARALGYESFYFLGAVENAATRALYATLGCHAVGECHLYETDFICYEALLDDLMKMN